MSPSYSTSEIATAVALVATSVSIGYVLGAKSVTAKPRSSVPSSQQAKLPPEEESDDEGDIADGNLSSIKPGLLEPCKLVLVVRTDLRMTTGKIAAQCGHATLACYTALLKTNPGLLHHWERTGQAKVALKGNSEDELLELEAVAKSLNLCARAIHDAGRTQIAAGSRTVLGIGPGPVELVNRVTGKLRLL